MRRNLLSNRHHSRRILTASGERADVLQCNSILQVARRPPYRGFTCCALCDPSITTACVPKPIRISHPDIFEGRRRGWREVSMHHQMSFVTPLAAFSLRTTPYLPRCSVVLGPPRSHANCRPKVPQIIRSIGRMQQGGTNPERDSKASPRNTGHLEAPGSARSGPLFLTAAHDPFTLP